jgi:hypothetical protein
MHHQPFYAGLIITYCLVINFNAFAQKKDSGETSYFKLSGSYLTNSFYNGRKDSAMLPYITPTLTYYDKSGFNISSSVSYLYSAAAKRIDLFSIDAGYDFKIAKQLSGSVYASKYFYNSNSTAVQEDTKGILGGTINYENNIISVGADIGILFSQKNDFVFTPSIYHSFEFGGDAKAWNIAPTVTANIGTLNYYKQYFSNITKKRTGVVRLVQVKNADGVLLLDYELSLPITYDGKKWGLFITPAYAIPQNPIQVTSPGGSVFREEKIENSFYGEFGVYVKF